MILNNLKQTFLNSLNFILGYQNGSIICLKYMYKNAPDVSFVGTVLDVVADCLEHAAGSGHWPAVKHLHTRKQVSLAYIL